MAAGEQNEKGQLDSEEERKRKRRTDHPEREQHQQELAKPVQRLESNANEPADRALAEGGLPSRDESAERRRRERRTEKLD